MAFVIQTIEDGPRNYIIKVDGDAVASTGALLVDVTTLNPPCSSVRIRKITYNLDTTAHVQLLWDATTDVVALNLYGSNDADMCFEATAGIPNNAGAGKTGNVLLTTSATITPYTLYIEFIKSGAVFPM